MLHTSTTRQRRALRIVCMAALAGVAIAVVGLAGLPTPSPAAAAAEDSSITVSWQGDSSGAAQYQPARDAAGIHYTDFENLKVRVSQTSDLVDQVVRVDVTGMPGVTAQAQDINVRANAYDFVQAMQCWGNPADENFNETCQWGGMLQGRGAAPEELPYNSLSRGTFAKDIPFRTAWGESLSSLRSGAGNEPPFYRDINAATTNEVLAARIADGGAGWFNFEAQTSNAAPHLGCGDTSSTGAGTRCWLVIVPRGQHTAPSSVDCPTDFEVTTPSARGKMQFGSPINPACGYWENRIVIPLDFQPTGDTCPPGSAERRTLGAPLIQVAMSSWQPELCQAVGSTFSFTSAPDPVARDQLLEGQVGLAFTGAPITVDTLGEDVSPDSLDETKIVYAPVAVSAPVIAFFATSRQDGRVEGLKLTPRLVAKLLTQSYSVQVPWNSSESHASHIRAGAQLWDDPEFRALNPEPYWSATGVGQAMPGLVMVLSGSDAVAQLWRWVQADDEAAAFLAGEPDSTGKQVNPYYLPRGHPDAHVLDLEEVPNVFGKTTLQPKPGNPQRPVGLQNDDGTPLCLCDSPVNTVPIADETQIPWELNVPTRRFDSVQFNPPVNSFTDAAINILRGNKNIKNGWDVGVLNAAGEPGDWVSTDSGGTSSRFLSGLTDSALLERYGLSAAQLQVPNHPGVFASPTPAGLSSALTAQGPTAVAGVTQTDFSKLADDAYPLAMITYAAVNLTKSDALARADYADMIEQVTTSGQVPGHLPGTLPEGYVPLTSDLQAQAAAAVQAIRDYTDPVGDESIDQASAPTSADAMVNAPTYSVPGTSVPGTSAPGGIGETATNVDDPNQTLDAEITATSGSGVTPIGIGALGGSLALGVSGALAAPFLLRRRGSP